MLATVTSAVLRGLECHPIAVEVDIAAGSDPKVLLVGLPSTAVREAVQRVSAGLRNAGFGIPQRRVTINLAPACLKKEGSGLDLAIAVAIVLASTGRTPPPQAAFVGELALDGAVRHVDGVLPIALGLRRRGLRRLYVPAADAPEAALVDGLQVVPCETLKAVLDELVDGTPIALQDPAEPHLALDAPPADDLAEVRGQAEARRALEIAAAGGHHLLMSGPPGSGKTMLARCLPGILPPLTREDAIEVAQVRSVLGELDAAEPLRLQRPFRSPHHTTSMPGLVGGGSSLARPGEITRAHHGILFLDELAEFEPRTLQALRQPLEEGAVVITRSGGAVRYPCRFLLVAATNPCPCGWSGDPVHACRCTPAAVDAYARALSGPLLDRVDLHVRVERLPLQALDGEPQEEPSAAVRERVIEARRRQLDRQGCLNSALRPRQFRAQGRLQPAARHALERWGERQGLTARAYQRACRVAATVADLEPSETVEERHALEALGYRVGDAAAA